MNTYTGYTLVTATQAFFKRYADFKGRSTLSAYWYWVLASIIFAIAAMGIDIAMGSEGGLVYSLWSLVTLIPGIAIAVRRLHDTGKSGWNLLWCIIPLIGAIIILVFVLKDSQKGTNKWGASEKYPEEA